MLAREIERLDAFYRDVLQLDSRSPRDTYREFQTQPGTFALWSRADFEQITGASVREREASGSVMLVPGSWFKMQWSEVRVQRDQTDGPPKEAVISD